MGKTSIEWCDVTWNPVRGCSRVSEGCRKCYAERQAARFAGGKRTTKAGTRTGAQPFTGFVHIVNGHPAWTGKVELVEDHLEEPLHWRKPQRVFVNSMSDLFHEALDDEAIDRVFAVMALCPQHTFQILTKRPERMLKYFGGGELTDSLDAAVRIKTAAQPLWPKNFSGFDYPGWPFRHVWLGVSVEDQATANERIPLLLQTLAAIRFVSYEPALGPVDFTHLDTYPRVYTMDALNVTGLEPPNISDNRLDQIIVGGESGPGARPFDIDWFRNVLKQCRAGNVAPFLKQVGSAPFDVQRYRQTAPWPLDVEWKTATEPRLRDRKGGDMSEWPEDVRVREFPRMFGREEVGAGEATVGGVSCISAPK